MTDEKILEEIRKYRKLSGSVYAKEACFAKRKAEKMMKEYGVTEKEL
ncbi:MAG TPA: hypothetical protein O0X39_01785 [Methanocorpusculum sp.]|nr:hypothetical protein [Methanocorpusculum sp.]